jgi:hypothetical protein
LAAAPEDDALDAKDPVTSLLERATADRTRQESSAPPLLLATTVDHLKHQFNMAREQNKLYECALLTVAVLMALILVLRFFRGHPRASPSDIVNAIGLIILVFGTIFVIILVDVDEQLTAAMGILGAIAGYLFGSMRRVGEGGSSGDGLRDRTTQDP